jgi:hypothetical protein
MRELFSMVFLFSVLLISWNLQDAGQHLAGAVLLVVSLALAFVLQVADKK